jgi:hypothetical protein
MAVAPISWRSTRKGASPSSRSRSRAPTFAVPAGFDLSPFEEPWFRPEISGLIVADRYDAAMLREPALRALAPARRKVETLRFARRAAQRLLGGIDPGLAGLD